MRVVLPLTALVLTTAAGAPETVQVNPAPDLRESPPARAACRDRIQEVRRELGKPELQRDARPQDPLLIAAVDKRIGSCSVMVMRNDTSDIRPLPAPSEHRMMPAR